MKRQIKSAQEIAAECRDQVENAIRYAKSEVSELFDGAELQIQLKSATLDAIFTQVSFSMCGGAELIEKPTWIYVQVVNVFRNEHNV